MQGKGSHPSTLAQKFKDDMVDPERSGDPIAAMRESHGSGLVDTRISNREDEVTSHALNKSNKRHNTTFSMINKC